MHARSVLLPALLAASVAASFPLRPLPLPAAHAPVDAARGLVARLLGSAYAGSFEFAAVATEGQLDVFAIDNAASGAIRIEGNTGVALASGLYWYLKARDRAGQGESRARR